MTVAYRTAGVGDMSFHMKVELSVWRLFDAETLSAKKDGRQPFLYVDLTSRHFLPIWLPGDAIGGTNLLGADWDAQTAQAETSTLAKLGKALRMASSSPRFFRTFAQMVVGLLQVFGHCCGGGPHDMVAGASVPLNSL